MDISIKNFKTVVELVGKKVTATENKYHNVSTLERESTKKANAKQKRCGNSEDYYSKKINHRVVFLLLLCLSMQVFR